MGSEAQSPASNKVLSPSVLAHVVLRTTASNFTRMVSFYKTFLGARATFENDTLSFLTYDQLDHRLAIAAVPGTTTKNPSSAGMDHGEYAFESSVELFIIR